MPDDPDMPIFTEDDALAGVIRLMIGFIGAPGVIAYCWPQT